jgi:hypothetical protein
MLFFHPMERGHLLSSKYVLLALAKRKQLPAAVYTVHVYLLLALANKKQLPAAACTLQYMYICCWLLPIKSSSLLLSTYVLLALANKNTGIISATYSKLSLPRFKRDLGLNPE